MANISGEIYIGELIFHFRALSSIYILLPYEMREITLLAGNIPVGEAFEANIA
jgi:hypothetical protein